MKNCWSLFIPLSVMTLNFAGFMMCAQPLGTTNDYFVQQTTSRESTTRILAEVYLLSDPMNDPNELIQYIQSKPDNFNEDGAVTIAARNLGNWILSNDVKSFKKDCLEKIQEELENENIPGEYASELLSDIKKSNLDCKSIGRELVWLSDILPRLKEGDIGEYLYTRTEVRQSLRKVAPVYESIHNSDPEIAEIILKDKNCYNKKMADQIQILALISDKN